MEFLYEILGHGRFVGHFIYEMSSFYKDIFNNFILI